MTAIGASVKMKAILKRQLWHRPFKLYEADIQNNMN